MAIALAGLAGPTFAALAVLCVALTLLPGVAIIAAAPALAPMLLEGER